MIIYQGIQLVYTHIQQLLGSISNWFQNIDWTSVIDLFPIQYQAPLQACIVLVLALASIGLIKKLSFMLG